MDYVVLNIPCRDGEQCEIVTAELAAYCRREKDTLWEETKRLFYPHQIYVDLSPKLYGVKKELLDQVNKA